jgi:hypothetical protein
MAWNANHTFYMTGSLTASAKGFAIALASQGAFSAIGSAGFGNAFGNGFGAHVARSIAHGLVGGVSSVLQGGKFGHGFASAGLTKFVNVNGMFSAAGMGDVSYDAARVVAAAVIGGTISEATGGKFANGAVTAAWGQMFNGNKQNAREQNCSGQMCRAAGKPSMQEERNAKNDEWIAKNIRDPLNITADDLKTAGFGDPETAARSKFHNNWFGFEGNKKYVHPEGYEIVVDINNALVTHPAVMGTYNYGHNNVTHIFLDIVPYYIHGNSAQDSTTFSQRFMKSFE